MIKKMPAGQPHKKPEILKLTADEMVIIKRLREKAHQEVIIKVQDGVIVCIKRSETWVKKKGRFL